MTTNTATVLYGAWTIGPKQSPTIVLPGDDVTIQRLDNTQTQARVTKGLAAGFIPMSALSVIVDDVVDTAPNTDDPAVQRGIGKLAQVLLEDVADGDGFELAQYLRPVLTPDVWDQLASAMEMCPEHGCDVYICVDDESPCQYPWLAGR